MSGFANPVVGGQGALVRTIIRSPNFSIPAHTGWGILRDGSAYFFNVTASGVVTANSVIIDGAGNGVFIYGGIPALGNLIVSATSGAGVDGEGNHYSGPGISVSAPGLGAGKNIIQIRPDLKAMLVYASS